VARFVHHVWMMDITEVEAFLGVGVFHVAGVFDAFSRVPLALQVFEHKPGAAAMARLLRAAARRFGVPRYLITDLGGEFRGRVFARAVGRLGVRQRFASAANLLRHRTPREVLENAQGDGPASVAAAADPRGSGEADRAGPHVLPALQAAPGPWRCDSGRSLRWSRAGAHEGHITATRSTGTRPSGPRPQRGLPRSAEPLLPDPEVKSLFVCRSDLRSQGVGSPHGSLRRRPSRRPSS
jgi:hypothetical protein